jgi:hypothetical protein
VSSLTEKEKREIGIVTTRIFEECRNGSDHDMQEDMIGAVVETLEEKGIMTGRDIDNKMRKKLRSKKQLTIFEELG